MENMENNNKKTNPISDWVYSKFIESMNNKQSTTKAWQSYLDAYVSSAKKEQVDYKSDLDTNFIFSTIESILPIMADEEPIFEVLPRNATGVASADILNKCMEYEFDRERIRTKLFKQLRYGLITGNSVWFLGWDKNAGKDGNVKCTMVNPFSIFPDPNTIDIQEGEYVIYATYKHINELKKAYPEQTKYLVGGDIKYRELANNQNQKERTDTQVLVLECWCKDYTYIDVEEENKEGESVKKKQRQFPNGRVITCAPEVGILLSDKPNPYKDGKFPFVIMKNHDIAFEFWGKGDVQHLLSAQKHINELSNQIIDNAKNMGNGQWIVDKNCGIPKGQLTNRPGLIIRKNPGTEMRREAPVPMPSYIRDQIDAMKMDIETISGVHDVTQGRRPGGIQAGNAIMALQEAGQARIRIKIKIMEEALTEVARMWYSRIKQFWVVDRYVRIANSTDEQEYQFLNVNKNSFEDEYDIRIKSGSTMQKNKASMLDLYIRLAQTMAEDGLPMIDRASVLEYTPIPNKRDVIAKFESIKNNQMEQQMQQIQQELETLRTQIAEQVQVNQQTIQENTQAINQLDHTVQRMEDEHENIKVGERLTDAKSVGFEHGVAEMRNNLMKLFDESISENNMFTTDTGATMGATSDEILGMGNGLDTSLIEMLNELPPEQLMALMQQYPELQQLVVNERPQQPEVSLNMPTMTTPTTPSTNQTPVL